MKKMEKKVELNLRVAIILLLPLFIFSYLALAGVMAQNGNGNEVEAEVTVAPVATINCIPDALFVGSSVSSIICQLEFTNADVNDIDLSTVELDTSDGCFLPVPADQGFFTVINDVAHVRFDRNTADANCFGPPASATDFILLISGVVGGFPFSGADGLDYLVRCQDGHVHNMLWNVTAKNTARAPGGIINTLDIASFDLSQYSPDSFSLNGFFDCRPSGRIVGNMKFFTKGSVTEEIFRFRFWSSEPIIFYKKVPVQISAVFDTLDNCVASTDPTHVECVGRGTLFIDREQPFKRERISLDNIRVEINGNTATVQGGEIFNDILDVDRLDVSKIKIKASLPKI